MVAWARQRFHVICMFSDPLRYFDRLRMWAPQSHGRVGRGGNERRVVLCQDDVVDPMTVGLDLGLEASRTGLLG